MPAAPLVVFRSMVSFDRPALFEQELGFVMSLVTLGQCRVEESGESKGEEQVVGYATVSGDEPARRFGAGLTM